MLLVFGGLALSSSVLAGRGSSVRLGVSSSLRPTRRMAAAAGATADPTSKPVAVLGANGRTGRLCVEELVKRGQPVKALTRTGKFDHVDSPLVSVEKADVTDPQQLRDHLDGCQAAIFAAAYSRNTGNDPSEIDNQGLANTAMVSKELGLSRVVCVSSGAVTRPYSPVGLLLNTVGKGVLFQKRRGENRMREVLKDSGCDYVIIRPGGLRDTPALGPTKTELNQGDTVVGSIPRQDVAAAAVAAAIAPKDLVSRTTFEMYSLDPENEVEPNRLLPWYALPSGYESSGLTWEEAFETLKPDERLSPRGFY